MSPRVSSGSFFIAWAHFFLEAEPTGLIEYFPKWRFRTQSQTIMSGHLMGIKQPGEIQDALMYSLGHLSTTTI